MIAFRAAKLNLSANRFSPESMTISQRPLPIESPCNKICTVDSASGLCIGCGRNLAEIESWIRLSDKDRARVIADLPQRLARLRRPEHDTAT
jgi:predicted Fe-S protein YdhL (DUF1289 family)